MKDDTEPNDGESLVINVTEEFVRGIKIEAEEPKQITRTTLVEPNPNIAIKKEESEEIKDERMDENDGSGWTAVDNLKSENENDSEDENKATGMGDEPLMNKGLAATLQFLKQRGGVDPVGILAGTNYFYLLYYHYFFFLFYCLCFFCRCRTLIVIKK